MEVRNLESSFFMLTQKDEFSGGQLRADLHEVEFIPIVQDFDGFNYECCRFMKMWCLVVTLTQDSGKFMNVVDPTP